MDIFKGAGDFFDKVLAIEKAKEQMRQTQDRERFNMTGNLNKIREWVLHNKGSKYINEYMTAYKIVAQHRCGDLDMMGFTRQELVIYANVVDLYITGSDSKSDIIRRMCEDFDTVLYLYKYNDLEMRASGR